ncbi:MAG: SIR2 family NAD-dependent protein deacylase [Wenzhouxiangella sp.]
MQMVSSGTPLPGNLLDELRRARRVAVLTGAGVSAESGVPTFRDARSGLWAKHDPMALASPEGFARDPALVWDWYQWRRELVANTLPNAGHTALADLQALFDEYTLVTQNVDGLHQAAGSSGVLELHGNIQRTICSTTRKAIDEDWLTEHAGQRPPPSPHHDNGLARPDVVWFGEVLDSRVLNAAFAAASRCQLMIVVGTAGVVHPAASIPHVALDAGATMIDINPIASELSPLADWHLAGTSAHWLPVLASVRAH